jgi:23S rRNA (cytidine1920-2'-O)/16S rRNA (cytidine1409-2'-O)-methyltransferase
VCALDFSPIKGPEGNIEYLIHLKKSENEAGENLGGLDPVIVSDRAFETLAKQHA